MSSIINRTLKATIIQIIVALFSTFCIFSVIYLFFGQKIEYILSIINKISVNTNNKIETITTINENNKINTKMKSKNRKLILKKCLEDFQNWKLGTP